MKDALEIPDQDIFASVGTLTLADLQSECERALTGTGLRDMRSAFRFLSETLEADLSSVLARPQEVRALFTTGTAERAGASRKRLANVKSLITRAVRENGMRRTWVTREIPLDATWMGLLNRIEDKTHRWGLSRFAAYCTVKGIDPQDVASETLVGFELALGREEISKDPRNIRKHTIALWNMCLKRLPGWPQVRLSAPNKTAPYMLPLKDFPASFQADVAAWETRIGNPDPLDPTAPIRAYRQDTLQGYCYTFRRLATALVRSGLVSVEEVTGLDVFFDEQRFTEMLRPFLPGERIKTQGYSYKMATQMLAVGRHHLRYEDARLAPFICISQRLKPKGGPQMGERNRTRLAQFDDDEVVARLLGFPDEELARALKLSNPIRRAKGVERALAISLAIFTGLRVKNLRELRIDWNIRRSGRRVFIRVFEDEAKTHAALELELPQETIVLLDLFLNAHRGLLPGSQSSYLFAGATSGARSYSAMRDALGKPLWKHAGIKLSPHLYRHIIAKIVIERHPELALDVSRRLGHKSVNTTYQSYLGTEGPAASRRVNDLLKGLRDKDSKDAS